MALLLESARGNCIGNMIPHRWYSEITSRSGKPDYAAISIFSEIVYWYRPNKDGDCKFASDLWQTSYEFFEDKFGYNKQKIRRALVRLEEFGFITRIYRTVVKFGQKYPNVLFIELIKLPESSFAYETITISNSNNNSNIVDPSILPAASDRDLVLSTDSCRDIVLADSNEIMIQEDGSLETKEKNFSLFHDRGLYKYDTPSLQICRDHIKEEEIKEEIKEKDQIWRGCAQSSFLNTFFSSVDEGAISNQKEDEVPLESNFSVTTGKIDNFGLMAGEFFKKLRSKKKPIDWEEGRVLRELCEISEEDADILNKRSGREFSKNFISQLVQKLGIKNPCHKFFRKEQFMNYMVKALSYEILQSPKANNVDFKFRCIPRTPEEEYMKGVNKYLEEIEGSTDTKEEMRLKKKILGRLEANIAYEILKGTSIDIENIIGGRNVKKLEAPETLEALEALETEESSEISTLEKLERRLVVKVIRPLQLRLNQGSDEEEEIIPGWIKTILLQASQEIYGKEVNQIVVRGPYEKKQQRKGQKEESEEKEELEERLENTENTENIENTEETILGKAKKLLKDQFGKKTYNTWFKKLTMEERAENEEVMRVKSPTSFMRDWIKNNYGRAIEEVLKSLCNRVKYVEFV